MKRFLVSFVGYFQNIGKTEKIISNLIHSIDTHTLLIDRKSIETFPSSLLHSSDYSILKIDCGFNLLGNITEKLLNPNFGKNTILIFDFSSLTAGNILDLLTRIQEKLLLIDKEFAALVIICEDSEIPEVLPQFLRIFRITGLPLNSDILNENVNNIMRRVRYIKYKEFNPFYQKLKRIYLKVRNQLKNLLGK